MATDDNEPVQNESGDEMDEAIRHIEQAHEPLAAARVILTREAE